MTRPSLMFSNEIETSGGHISSTTAVWEVPLGFLDALGFPFKNTSKLEKCQKSREIAIFDWPSLRFSIKIETSGGHNSSTPWSWRLRSGFSDAPWILLHKSIFFDKVTRDPLNIYTHFTKTGPNKSRNRPYLRHGGELSASDWPCA